MAPRPRKYKIRRVANELVEEATRLGDPVKFGLHKEKKMTERWEKELYGKVKAVTGFGIGGQMPGSGPDVLKYIKQHDPNNSSGAVKDSLDVMLKFQELVKSGDLLKNVQPIQSILGGLYGKFQSAAASSAASAKTKKKKKKKTEVVVANTVTGTVTTEIIEEEVEEDLGVVAELIDAVMAMLEPDIAVEAAELLNDDEITKIETAYYTPGGVYASTVMPMEFVNAINYLMPIFRSTKGTGTGVA